MRGSDATQGGGTTEKAKGLVGGPWKGGSSPAELTPSSLPTTVGCESRVGGAGVGGGGGGGRPSRASPASSPGGGAPFTAENLPVSGFDVSQLHFVGTGAMNPPRSLGARPKSCVGVGQQGRIEQEQPSPSPKQQEQSPTTGSADSQAQINLIQYRERLARDMERRELMVKGGEAVAPSRQHRVSPIQEEESMDSTPTSLMDLPAASADSVKTVRGSALPTPSAMTSATPSYPFPRMKPALSTAVQGTHAQSFEAPGGARPRQSHGGAGPTDTVLSNQSSPPSAVTFQPAGFHEQVENPAFPSPNLYELSLMLNAEPGLEAWWNSVIQIMTEVYRAERVTLSVPADATDIQNVPWGQKATYNGRREDEFSMGYMGRGSSRVAGSTGGQSEGPTPNQETSRPKLSSRHSFTAYEETKEKEMWPDVTLATRRPAAMPRSKSYRQAYQGTDEGQASADASSSIAPELSRETLAEYDADEAERSLPNWEAPFATQRPVQGRILSVLQALDYEADPLIDHNGITRVIERGRVIALTRTYPYLGDPGKQHATQSTPASRGQDFVPKRRTRKARTDVAPNFSMILGGVGARGSKGTTAKSSLLGSLLGDDIPRPQAPRYEEYEQAPPSPWSQSPAPSPVVRTDPKENPFFTDALVDEESFNPGPASQDYSTIQPPEAIGLDNSWTVLHIPLKHVLLSKPTAPGFKLDSTVPRQKAAEHRGHHSTSAFFDPSGHRSPGQESHRANLEPPIAILSILSPIIPYPSNLRHSLEHLGPHLATSFSLNRHYTNLETELAGLQRRRPHTTGFGAIAPDGRPMADVSNLSYLAHEDVTPQRSLAGSITSPSDYSGPTRSSVGSPGGTPMWEPTSLGLVVDRRTSGVSPGPVPDRDSYFSSKSKAPAGPGFTRLDTNAGTLNQRASNKQSASREGSPSDKRITTAPARVALTSTKQQQQQQQQQRQQEGTEPTSPTATMGTGDLGDLPNSPMTTPQPRMVSRESTESFVTALEPEPQRSGGESSSKAHTSHTMLHSYGADFDATFQSLPPSSMVGVKPTGPSRSGTVGLPASDMLPPSDRLKSLILDSLPTHVFVALPQTGEIVWVNSRFLAYRGQTVADLVQDAWGSIHPDDRDDYIRAWAHSLRTGDQFSRIVRIRRFDGAYRWFYARAVASRDKRGVIVQFLGSYMDIHDQRIAELRAARQEEIEASEAKHRLLANLIPQIIFTATEEDGITFANEQWLSYTGQGFEDSLGLGFMDYVHPDDLAKCRIPPIRPPTPPPQQQNARGEVVAPTKKAPVATPDATLKVPVPASAPGTPQAHAVTFPKVLSRHNSSSSSGSSWDHLTGDLHDLVKAGIIKVSRDGSGRLSYTTEVRLRSKTGEYRWHLIRCVEIDGINLGTGASSYFGSATDINDLKLLETKLKEAMDSKGRFLSNMSHEIRTPLIGISGMVSFLQDTVLNEEQRDYTNTIQTSANSLLMIINDILDLSKIDAGMMRLSYDWLHMRSLIEDVNELVSTMAIAKRLELSYIIEDDVPAWVKGDKVRIRQVLLNIIGNAIKFTTEGEVFSRCRVLPGQRENDETLSDGEIMLEFSVSDTGRGFTKEEAELIFKPFSQIDESSTRQHGGSGLGLVISRQLVELHGGHMEGTAERGKGSTFTFTARFGLPTADDHPADPENPPEQLGDRIPDEISPHKLLSKPFPAAALKTPQATVPMPGSETASPEMDVATTTTTTDIRSPATTMVSSGSSDPSVRSFVTGRSSVSPPGPPQSAEANPATESLAHFNEAALAGGTNTVDQMKLEMPSERSSPGGTDATPTPETSRTLLVTGLEQNPEPEPKPEPKDEKVLAASDREPLRPPPMYSILVVCPQPHSREATMKHIEMTLPKDFPHHISSLGNAVEAERLLTGGGGADAAKDPVVFTHVVLNLPSPEEITRLVDRIMASASSNTSVIILSDSVQRQALMKLASSSPTTTKTRNGTATGQPATTIFGRLLAEKRVVFVNKPVKPSRFAAVFDPDNLRRADLTNFFDQTRSAAERMIEFQKQTYAEATRRMGNKGYRVLLVEDNLLNQKVLRQFLGKIGVEVEIAADGVECTDKVFARDPDFYSLVLVSRPPTRRQILLSSSTTVGQC